MGFFVLLFCRICLKASEIKSLFFKNIESLPCPPGGLKHPPSGKYHPHEGPELARGTLGTAPPMSSALTLPQGPRSYCDCPSPVATKNILVPSLCHRLEYKLGQVYLTGETLFRYLRGGWDCGYWPFWLLWCKVGSVQARFSMAGVPQAERGVHCWGPHVPSRPHYTGL